MAKPQKLSRTDVYKQIDAFRGIYNRNPGAKLSAEQWAIFKRAAMGLPHKELKTAK